MMPSMVLGLFLYHSLTVMEGWEIRFKEQSQMGVGVVVWRPGGVGSGWCCGGVDVVVVWW